MSQFIPAKLTENAIVVLEKRYLRKDEEHNIIETPDEMFRRVAKAIAKVEMPHMREEVEDQFYKLMASLEFVPNSPTLMNAGTGAGCGSACFVLPVTDSMEGIMKAAHDAAMVQKYGGGTGFALSELRPINSPIKTTHGRACGALSVLKNILSPVSTLVTQGGKRDGANMAVMDVHHPEILDFIECKTKEGDIHNFNISVGATDEFMQAVLNDTTYELRFGGVVYDTPRARDVFEKIIYGAWRNGEPGMIFLDHVNKNSPVLHIGRIIATNPCGEQPLLPNESCTLGSINLNKFLTESEAGYVIDEEGERATKWIDWDKLEYATEMCIRFLDNVLDANLYATQDIEKGTLLTRKVGLGVMGFADILTKLGIPYNTEQARELGSEIMEFIDNVSLVYSEKLAKERGNFPGWEGSKFDEEQMDMRNACRLTVAPTGTISMIAGCSSGIEPLFSLAYRKQNILEGKTLYYVNEEFERVAREQGFYSDDLMEYLSNGGTLQDREEVPDKIKEIFRTSPEIGALDHVKMQASFQEYCDAGISKTINFPNEATEHDVKTAYLEAWNSGCKGITVYRAGSREKEVLTNGHSAEEPKSIQPYNKIEMPTTLTGKTTRLKTSRGKLYLTLNITEDGMPVEIFSSLGRSGGNDMAMSEAVSRLVSLCLRSRVPVDKVLKQLSGIVDEPVWDNGQLIKSVPDAMAQAMRLLLPDKMNILETNKVSTDDCPDCEGKLENIEGCQKCQLCGFSKC